MTLQRRHKFADGVKVADLNREITGITWMSPMSSQGSLKAEDRDKENVTMREQSHLRSTGCTIVGFKSGERGPQAKQRGWL